MTITERYTYWMEKDEWSYFDRNKKMYVMTDAAPEKAKISFEYWKKYNNIK